MGATRSFDVIVLGLGGVGSAVVYQLVRRGVRALGLEERGRAHSLGSSHGETRLTRKSYFSQPAYIPLLHQSERWWQNIEEEAGRELLVRVGHLVVAPHGSPLVPLDIEHLAARHSVPIELLRPEDVTERFPSFRIGPNHRAYVEAGAGYLLVEACVEACCALAERRGADLRFDEGVVRFEADGDGVRVTTVRGSYSAGALIVCAGAWAAKIMRDLELPLVVYRIPQTWFLGTNMHRARNEMPCFLYDIDEGTFYGAPAIQNRQVKVCGNRLPRRVVDDPSDIDRLLRPEDIHDVQQFIDVYMPGLPRHPSAHSMCMCTMTPDHRPIIGAHPGIARILFAAGLSGHGFKMAPAIGDALAEQFETGVAPASVAFLGVRGRATSKQPTLVL